MKKPIIHEFNPEVYPILFWVCTNATSDGLSELFEFQGDTHQLVTAIENNAASTSIAIRKSDRKRGAMVYTAKKSYLTGSIIAHEAVHVSDIYFQELGMMSQTFDCGNEPYAYLTGWAAKCINQARILK